MQTLISNDINNYNYIIANVCRLRSPLFFVQNNVLQSRHFISNVYWFHIIMLNIITYNCKSLPLKLRIPLFFVQHNFLQSWHVHFNNSSPFTVGFKSCKLLTNVSTTFASDAFSKAVSKYNCTFSVRLPS